MIARVRPMALDPGTSLDAALLQTPKQADRVRATIMSLFTEHGAMTDDRLVDLYLERARAFDTVPLVTPQSIRTRRHALVVLGQLREVNSHGTSNLGNRASVWGLA